MIYELVLSPRKTYSKGHTNSNDTPKPNAEVGLLTTSRSIRAESLPMWFSSNTFVLYGCIAGNQTRCSRNFNRKSFQQNTNSCVSLVGVGSLTLAGINALTWQHHRYRLTEPTILAGQRLNTKQIMPHVYVTVEGNECKVSVRDMCSPPTSPAVKAMRLACSLEAERRARKMVATLEVAMKRKLEVVKYDVR